MSKYKIGDLLTRIKNSIDIQDEIEYKRVTIKSKNQGIFLRDIKKGSEIGTKKQFLINEGQFLLSKIDARNGAFGIVSKELNSAIITGNFWTYRINDELLNIEWFNLFVSSESFCDICNKASSGTTNRKYLDENLFLEYIIELPSLEEQSFIVDRYKYMKSKYDIIDTELEKQEQIAIKLKEQILKDAIEGKLVSQDLQDENANILIEKIKKEKELLVINKKIKNEKKLPEINGDELNFELPNNWGLVRLGDISIIGTGSTPLKSNTSYYNNGTIPWITSSSTGSDYILNADTYITDVALNECNLKINPIGTLIVAMYGQGKTRGQVSELLIEATTNQACATIIPIMREMQPYIKLYFKKIYNEIRELAVGGAQPNLNQQKIKNYCIPIPPLNEQKRIINKVNELMNKYEILIHEIKNYKEKVKQLKISMIDDLLN